MQENGRGRDGDSSLPALQSSQLHFTVFTPCASSGASRHHTSTTCAPLARREPGSTCGRKKGAEGG
eukprot:scaffold238_cov111-Isochrysis_galbana.AAC.7